MQLHSSHETLMQWVNAHAFESIKYLLLDFTLNVMVQINNLNYVYETGHEQGDEHKQGKVPKPY